MFCFFLCFSRKMIMTQVLSTLLKDGFSSLEDLPSNVRNDVLLELAKLAGQGKLSGEQNFRFHWKNPWFSLGMSHCCSFLSQLICKKNCLLNWPKIYQFYRLKCELKVRRIVCWSPIRNEKNCWFVAKTNEKIKLLRKYMGNCESFLFRTVLLKSFTQVFIYLELSKFHQ